MTDMIERVAVAINQTMLLHDDYDPDLLARAAIAAMRDCTPEMLDAGSAAHPAGGYTRVRLIVGNYWYEHDTLRGLLLAVFRHRLWHWCQGDGWID